MQIIHCLQCSPEWYAARCGRVTASRFSDAVSVTGELDERQETYVRLILSGLRKDDALSVAGYKAAPTSDLVRRALLGEDTIEFSDVAKRYADDLALERISGEQHGEPVKAWVLDRGHRMEAEARRIRECRTGYFISESGICVSDDGIFAYSSDGFVDNDGLIEIKSPIDSSKIRRMWRTGNVSEYMHQMQGGMWITGREWCDFIMYVPSLAAVEKDLYVKRIYRDEEFINTMVKRLMQFEKIVSENEEFYRGEIKGQS